MGLSVLAPGFEFIDKFGESGLVNQGAEADVVSWLTTGAVDEPAANGEVVYAWSSNGGDTDVDVAVSGRQLGALVDGAVNLNGATAVKCLTAAGDDMTAERIHRASASDAYSGNISFGNAGKTETWMQIAIGEGQTLACMMSTSTGKKSFIENYWADMIASSAAAATAVIRLWTRADGSALWVSKHKRIVTSDSHPQVTHNFKKPYPNKSGIPAGSDVKLTIKAVAKNVTVAAGFLMTSCWNRIDPYDYWVE